MNSRDSFTSCRSARKRPIRTAIALIAVLALAMLSACGGGGSNGEKDKSVVLGDTLGFAGFDPLTTPAFATDYLSPAYDTLIERHGLDDFAPGLATKWDYDPQGPTLKLTLRENVKFTDGAAFNAEAVKANFDRGIQMDGGPWITFYKNLKSVEVVDDSNVTLHLNAPNPAILADLCFAQGVMVSPEALKDPKVLQTQPIGTGPYQFDAKASSNGKYVFTKNPDYWDPETQKMDTYELRAFQDQNAAANALRNGQLDAVQLDGDQARRAAGSEYEIHASGRLAYVIDIADREGKLVPALGDPKVRRAIGLAIDREAMVEAAYGGQGSGISTIFPENTVGYSAKVNDELVYDVDEAKKLLKEAGYEKGFEVDVYVIAFNEGIATTVAGMLAKVGITLNVRSVPDPGSFAEKVAKKESPMMIVGLGTRSPWEVYTAFGSASGRYNPMGISTKTIEEQADVVRSLSDPTSAEAAEAYSGLMDDLLWDDAVVLPLFTGDTSLVTVKGFDAIWNSQSWAIPSAKNMGKE